MTNPRVVVYLLTSNVESARTSRAQSLFDSNLYDVNLVNVTPPNDLKNRDKNSLENNRFQWALQDAATKYPNSYVIIAKDTSVSSGSANRIASIVSAAINANNKRKHPWDIFYLCNWEDRCDLYNEKQPITDMTTVLVDSLSPHGLQAVMFSPHGRDKVLGRKQLANGSTFPILQDNTYSAASLDEGLNNAVKNKHLTAISAVPNVVEYDVTAARGDDDYRKLNRCLTNATNSSNNSSNFQQVTGNSMNWLWLILIIILILIIVWLVLRQQKGCSTRRI